MNKEKGVNKRLVSDEAFMMFAGCGCMVLGLISMFCGSPVIGGIMMSVGACNMGLVLYCREADKKRA